MTDLAERPPHVPPQVRAAMTPGELGGLAWCWDHMLMNAVLAMPHEEREANSRKLAARAARLLRGKPASVIAWAVANTP